MFSIQVHIVIYWFLQFFTSFKSTLIILHVSKNSQLQFLNENKTNSVWLQEERKCSSGSAFSQQVVLS